MAQWALDPPPCVALPTPCRAQPQCPLCFLSAADCKASEVREFTAEFLEKVLEPSGWQAVWHTNVFEVLVEVNFMPSLSSRLPLAKSTSFQAVMAKAWFLIKVYEPIETSLSFPSNRPSVWSLHI